MASVSPFMPVASIGEPGPAVEFINLKDVRAPAHTTPARSSRASSAHPVTIVGRGVIAQSDTAEIGAAPELELVGVFDVGEDARHPFAAKPAVRAHRSLEELLADPAIEMVVNLTIHHAHFAVTSASLRAGRHVYSEKPLTIDPAQASELVAIAREHGAPGGLAIGASGLADGGGSASLGQLDWQRCHSSLRAGQSVRPPARASRRARAEAAFSVRNVVSVLAAVQGIDRLLLNRRSSPYSQFVVTMPHHTPLEVSLMCSAPPTRTAP
jgi:hypothetical protein